VGTTVKLICADDGIGPIATSRSADLPGASALPGIAVQVMSAAVEVMASPWIPSIGVGSALVLIIGAQSSTDSG
jgi:hypothetical protein